MKKVMVVDDSPVDTQHLVRILRDAGCQVVVASSGQEALQKVQTDKPDVIMMDVNMPGLDGFATTRKINGELGMKGVPIIFVTSKDQKADRVFAQMLGAKGYVTKPYSPEQILAHIA
jgi:twitching motility two-component system response regulator PilH